uniref:AlNc14C273G10001 protein n=1 Tax=Albugo laibachii Nc14 TaxID=890382 RepID=F0WUJ0_9STRA|nr:AlNc14C273G10001 [Albugo laibachii Nc14]|eukprot:CCA25071.1 AlNc14C273G10001 [Albugo laibachii Nc14]
MKTIEGFPINDQKVESVYQVEFAIRIIEVEELKQLNQLRSSQNHDPYHNQLDIDAHASYLRSDLSAANSASLQLSILTSPDDTPMPPICNFNILVPLTYLEIRFAIFQSCIRALGFILPRSGILWVHMTCDKQVWSLAHR